MTARSFFVTGWGPGEETSERKRPREATVKKKTSTVNEKRPREATVKKKDLNRQEKRPREPTGKKKMGWGSGVSGIWGLESGVVVWGLGFGV